jgi:hypothetical protein
MADILGLPTETVKYILTYSGDEYINFLFLLLITKIGFYWKLKIKVILIYNIIKFLGIIKLKILLALKNFILVLKIYMVIEN